MPFMDTNDEREGQLYNASFDAQGETHFGCSFEFMASKFGRFVVQVIIKCVNALRASPRESML